MIDAIILFMNLSEDVLIYDHFCGYVISLPPCIFIFIKNKLFTICILNIRFYSELHMTMIWKNIGLDIQIQFQTTKFFYKYLKCKNTFRSHCISRPMILFQIFQISQKMLRGEQQDFIPPAPIPHTHTYTTQAVRIYQWSKIKYGIF